MSHYPTNILNGFVAILWLLFVLYWIISAIGVKKHVAGKGSRGGWVLSRIGLIAGLIFIDRLPALAPFWNYADGLAVFHNEGARMAGTALTALGIGFAVWARRHLGTNWSGRPTMKVGHELVTSGPYQYVRNPIYTGILTALLGSSLVNGPIWVVAFFVALGIFTWRIGVEEGYMMELFPDEYPAYRARTKALIPAVW